VLRTRNFATRTESTLAIPYSSRVTTSHSPAQATICRAIKSAMRVDNGYGAVSFIILLIQESDYPPPHTHNLLMRLIIVVRNNVR